MPRQANGSPVAVRNPVPVTWRWRACGVLDCSVVVQAITATTASAQASRSTWSFCASAGCAEQPPRGGKRHAVLEGARAEPPSSLLVHGGQHAITRDFLGRADDTAGTPGLAGPDPRGESAGDGALPARRLGATLASPIERRPEDFVVHEVGRQVRSSSDLPRQVRGVAPATSAGGSCRDYRRNPRARPTISPGESCTRRMPVRRRHDVFRTQTIARHYVRFRQGEPLCTRQGSREFPPTASI